MTFSIPKPFLRQVMFAALVASGSFAAGPTAADQGGSDPIEGIDIIIRKDVSSIPIAPFSTSGDQLEKLNALKGRERAGYLSELIANHINKLGDFKGEVRAKDIMNGLAERGCPPKPLPTCFEQELKVAVADDGFTLQLAGSINKR